MIEGKQMQRPQLVLVVDDQELNRDAIGVILEDDYDLIFAENGQEALALMREHIDDLSLVLLDLMMPVMDGFAVLKAVRQDEQLSKIPIIVLTADKNAELEALEEGAADFITKPFDLPEVVIARAGRIIELSEGRKLISAAEHDRLTQLYTRSFFFEYAKRLHLYHSDTRMDAIVMNIEQFHIINELNGRHFGDEVLKALGEEIRSFLSETEGIASRSEADRFYIYCAQQSDYGALLARFQNRVHEIYDSVRIHLRMGVMPYQEGLSLVQTFDRARAACNMVRGNYQHPVLIYDESMREKEHLNQRLLDDLRQAVEKKQFKVYYQPKYDIRTNPPRLSSAEALIRWNHPDMGLISPSEFIPLFEGNGLISIIDSFVWQEAAQQAARWRDMYHVTLPISVNLSRADMYDPALTDRLQLLVKDNGLRFSDLKLEVTESACTDNANLLLEKVSRLRDLGFDVEMDDFGSGYSSLNMLSSMPVDVLKMDMKFVRNIENSEKDLRLVKLIIDIAAYLGVLVVAEGVENEGQLALLRDAGCDLVQGFYFSKPVPAEDFEKLIEREQTTEREA